MKNYYEILEVNEHASQEIIEKAYKVLVKKYHPDLYKGEEKIYAEQKVRDINEAYKVLSDDFLKSQYDIELQREKNEVFYNSQHEINKKRTEGRVKKAVPRPEINFKRDNGEKNNEKPVRKNNVGSIGGIIDLLKEIIKVRPKKIEREKISKLDLIAFGLTIVILIIIGIALWFIPFTNAWMRQLTLENPLFSWIWN